MNKWLFPRFELKVNLGGIFYTATPPVSHLKKSVDKEYDEESNNVKQRYLEIPHGQFHLENLLVSPTTPPVTDPHDTDTDMYHRTWSYNSTNHCMLDLWNKIYVGISEVFSQSK